MPYYTKNAGLIGPGSQSSRVGVHDLDLARLHPIGAAVIPTQNLYSHWDLSRLSDPVGTTYSTTATTIPGTSGTSIGSAAGTPALTYYFTSTQNTTTVSQTSSGKKYLSFSSGGASGTGSYIQSGGNAFPDITSSGYSWVAVFKFGSAPSGYLPAYAWFLSGYYDYNHGRFWVNPNSPTGEINGINYASSQAYAATGSGGLQNRGQANQLVADVVSITGTSAYIASCVGSNTPSTGSFTIATVTYSTQGDANRIFKIFENFYATSRPALDAYEFGFYSAPLSQSDCQTTATALYNKWSA